MPDPANADYNGVANAIHESIRAADHAVATSVNADLSRVAESIRMIANAVVHIAAEAVTVSARAVVTDPPAAGIQGVTYRIAGRIEVVDRAAIARTATVYLSFIAHAVNEANSKACIIRSCGTQEAEAIAAENQGKAAREASVSLRRVADSIVGANIPSLAGAIAEAIDAATCGNLKRVADAICEARAAAGRTVDAAITSVDLRQVGHEILLFAEAIETADQAHGVVSGTEQSDFDRVRATAEQAVFDGLADDGLRHIARAINEAITAADRAVRRTAAKLVPNDLANLAEGTGSPTGQSDDDDDDDPVDEDGSDLTVFDDEYHGFDEP